MFYPFFFFPAGTEGIPNIQAVLYASKARFSPLQTTMCPSHPSRPGSSVQGEGAAAAAGLGNTTPGLLLVKNRPPAAFIASPALTCGNI